MKFRRLFVLFLIGFLAMTNRPALADLVIVAGNAPDLTPGQIIKTGTTLSIPEGAKVTLVSETGKMVILKGPHSGPVAIQESGKTADNGLISSLSNLLDASGKDKMSLGVMRSGRVQAPPPGDPWVIDVARTGNHCVNKNWGAKLWRTKTANARTLSLKNLQDKSKSTIEWPAGSHVLDWPADVTLTNGGQYLLRVKGEGAFRKIDLHIAPDDLSMDIHLVAWLTNKGCKKQAIRLLARVVKL